MADLGKEPGVGSIDEDVEESWSSFGPALRSRDFGYNIRNTLQKRVTTHEETSLKEMLFISQPQGSDLVDLDY